MPPGVCQVSRLSQIFDGSVGFFVALLTGLAIFLIWLATRKRLASQIVGRAEEQAQSILQEAKRAANGQRKEVALAAKEEAHEVRRQTEAQILTRHMEVAAGGQEAARRAAALDRLRTLDSRPNRILVKDQTVADIGEHAVIEKILARVPPVSDEVVLGIGDDAAVLKPDRNTLGVVTTDTLVEEVHFDRTFTPMEAVGHKALAVSLSDLAAMGAIPRHALISLAMPDSLAVDDLDAFLDGFLGLAHVHRVDVVGGNVTRSPHPLFIEVTVMGSAKRRRVLSRHGARPGDDLYVSGELGGAAAGLAWLQTETKREHPSDAFSASRERYLRPQPRVRLGNQLGRNRAARACIDLSDGLADGVRQLTTASSVGAVLYAEQLPIAPEATQFFRASGVDPVAAAVEGGEDYELLFTAPPSFARRITAVRRRSGAVPVTRIGQVTKDQAVLLRRGDRDEELPDGFGHFREKIKGLNFLD